MSQGRTGAIVKCCWAVAVLREQVSGAARSTSGSRGVAGSMSEVWSGRGAGCCAVSEPGTRTAQSWVAVACRVGASGRECLELCGRAQCCAWSLVALLGVSAKEGGKSFSAGSESKEGCLSQHAHSCSPGVWGFSSAMLVPWGMLGGVVFWHSAARWPCCICQCMPGDAVLADFAAGQLHCSQTRVVRCSLCRCCGPHGVARGVVLLPVSWFSAGSQLLPKK